MTIISFFVAFLLVALLVYVLRYSGRLRFSLEEHLAIPADRLLHSLSDLETWITWNPWQEHDSKIRPVLGRDSAGAVRTCAWQNDKAVKIAVTHLKTGRTGQIVQRLEGNTPFSYRGKITWTVESDPGGATVKVSFRGRIGFAQRAFSKTVQKMLELDFSYALNKLAWMLTQEQAEARQGLYQIMYQGEATVEAHELPVRMYEGASKHIGSALQPLIEQMRIVHGCPVSHEAEVFYLQTNLKTGVTKCKYGISGVACVRDEVCYSVKSFSAFVVRLQGDLRGLEVAWYLATQQMRGLGLQPDQRTPPFERYAYGGHALPDYVDLYFPVRQAA